MFNKKVLSLAVASVATGMALSAQAVVNLDDDTGKATYAQETVASNTSGTYVVQDNATSSIDVEAEIGVGVAEDDQVFVRFDLTGGTWGTALANTALSVDVAATTTTVTGTIAQDGGATDSTVIFAVTADSTAATTGTGFAQDDDMTLDLTQLAMTAPGKSVDIQAGVYETLTLAIAGSTPLNQQSTSGAVALSAALSTTYTPDEVVADVETDFTLFEGGASTGAIGSIDVNVNTNFLNAADSSNVTVADIVTLSSSDITYEDAFDFGTWELNTQSDCGGATTALSIDTSAPVEAEATMDDVNGNFLCVEVSGTESIPEAVYTAEIDYSDVNTAPAFAIPDSSGAAGEIDRNGTTVEIAYLTTFTDYNQRIIVVNRNNTDVEYSISFSTEAGVTATAGSAATGTLPAGNNLVLRASDVVTLTGGTRCAATFTAVSPADRIDVATTQVNLSDGGTDTVRYDTN